MPETRARTVFVVDDEPTISSTFAMILNSSGYSAASFTSAKDAMIAAEPDGPDLLLTDVAMPEMNGIELAIRFRSICPDCKVLLVSGHLSTGKLLDDAKQRGYDFQILAKPVQPSDMLAAIKKSMN